MLTLPRVIAIDDDPRHLKGIADGLNVYGASCLQIHFTGDDSNFRACPHVRIIFADLHLNEGGAGGNHERHFAIIGGLIEEKITPAGPYVVVLWTRFPDEAEALAAFLDERLNGVPKPFAVASLSKMIHLNEEGSVKDPGALVAAISQIVGDQPQIAALIDWEERVLGAAADTVGAVLGFTGEGSRPERATRLRQLLFHLAEGAVGEGHVERDRFRAVNEALLPILADRVATLRQREGADPWRTAFDDSDTRSALSEEDAGGLNRFSHIAESAPSSGAERGAVLDLPIQMSGDAFSGVFGLTTTIASADQFGCKDYVEGDDRFAWRLVQIQAACDYAQHQPGPLPFLLGLEMPINSVKGSPPQALWTSPALRFERRTRILTVSARFQISLSRTTVASARAVYRLREQLLSELIYRTHVYGARPGTISFRKKKAKVAPNP